MNLKRSSSRHGKQEFVIIARVGSRHGDGLHSEPGERDREVGRLRGDDPLPHQRAWQGHHHQARTGDRGEFRGLSSRDL